MAKGERVLSIRYDVNTALNRVHDVRRTTYVFFERIQTKKQIFYLAMAMVKGREYCKRSRTASHLKLLELLSFVLHSKASQVRLRCTYVRRTVCVRIEVRSAYSRVLWRRWWGWGPKGP